MSVAFDVTASAALPSVVKPGLLVKANANLVTAQMTAQEIGSAWTMAVRSAVPLGGLAGGSWRSSWVSGTPSCWQQYSNWQSWP
jgi:hypothetical protein